MTEIESGLKRPALVGDSSFWEKREAESRERDAGDNKLLCVSVCHGEYFFDGSPEAVSEFKAFASICAKRFQTYDVNAPWKTWVDEMIRQKVNCTPDDHE